MLTEKQNKMIQMLVEGKTKTAIAKELKMSRQTIYDWLKIDEISPELDRRRQIMCNEALGEAKSDVKKLLAELERLALTSESESIRVQCINSLLDRILGRPSTKSEISIDKATESDIELDDIDTLLDDNNTIDNVIELDKAK